MRSDPSASDCRSAADRKEGTLISERSYARITKADLTNLYLGSVAQVNEFYLRGRGRKWLELYDIRRPLAVALCQGAALHYENGSNGVKDFDVWFFFAFNTKHLPYRHIMTWCYETPKFGRHPEVPGCVGRKVDVIVRSVRNYDSGNPAATIQRYLTHERTASARALARKSVVLLSPEHRIGEIVFSARNITNA